MQLLFSLSSPLAWPISATTAKFGEAKGILEALLQKSLPAETTDEVRLLWKVTVLPNCQTTVANTVQAHLVGAKRVEGPVDFVFTTHPNFPVLTLKPIKKV